jgi:type IV secretory pathway VirJ component
MLKSLLRAACSVSVVSSLVLAGTTGQCEPAQSSSTAQAASVSETFLEIPPFAKTHIYRTAAQPSRVWLLLSGQDGWSSEADGVARQFTSIDSLVIGVDAQRYYKQKQSEKAECVYAAGDLKALAEQVEKKLGYTKYVVPSLVGIGQSGTFIYAILTQSTAGTFESGVSIPFCRRSQIDKPFCMQNPHLRPASIGEDIKGLNGSLLKPWLALNGTIDPECSSHRAEKFVRATANAKMVILRRQSLDLKASAEWFPLLKNAWLELMARADATARSKPPEVLDLPLIEVQAKAAGQGSLMAVITSGDGGWADIDKDMAKVFAGKGIPVVGLNTLQYLWRPKDPQTAGKDLGRILEHYLEAWHKSKAMLIGYSFGADIAPFMASDLNPALKAKLSEVVLIGPSHALDFEFHLMDWLSSGDSNGRYKLLPIVEKLAPTPVLCIAGTEEEKSLCHYLKGPQIRSIFLEGDHHLNGDFKKLARVILESLPVADRKGLASE